MILCQPVAASEICRRLNGELPAGLEILEAAAKRRSSFQAISRLVTYEATLPSGAWPPEGFQRFERQILAPLRQKTKRGEVLIPLENRLTSLEALAANRVRFSVIQARNGNIRIRDLLIHIFELSVGRVQDTRIVKISSEPIEG